MATIEPKPSELLRRLGGDPDDVGRLSRTAADYRRRAAAAGIVPEAQVTVAVYDGVVLARMLPGGDLAVRLGDVELHGSTAALRRLAAGLVAAADQAAQ